MRLAAIVCVFSTPASDIHPYDSSSISRAYVITSSSSPPYSSGMREPNSPNAFICSTIGSG